MSDFSIKDEDRVAYRRWKHDLRNAANSTQLALDVASRMMTAGNLPGAEANLRRAMDACGILASLLDDTSGTPRHE